MEKYAKYKEMMEFLQKVDDIYEYYILNVEKEYFKNIASEEDNEKFDEKIKLVEEIFANFEDLKENLNEVAFELVESR